MKGSINRRINPSSNETSTALVFPAYIQLVKGYVEKNENSHLTNPYNRLTQLMLTCQNQHMKVKNPVTI